MPFLGEFSAAAQAGASSDSGGVDALTQAAKSQAENEAAKVGKTALAGASAGASIGSAIGGPPGAALGAGIGAIAAVAAEYVPALASAIDQGFQGQGTFDGDWMTEARVAQGLADIAAALKPQTPKGALAARAAIAAWLPELDQYDPNADRPVIYDRFPSVAFPSWGTGLPFQRPPQGTTLANPRKWHGLFTAADNLARQILHLRAPSLSAAVLSQVVPRALWNLRGAEAANARARARAALLDARDVLTHATGNPAVAELVATLHAQAHVDVSAAVASQLLTIAASVPPRAWAYV